jgi:hypothetical protein
MGRSALEATKKRCGTLLALDVLTKGTPARGDVGIIGRWRPGLLQSPRAARRDARTSRSIAARLEASGTKERGRASEVGEESGRVRESFLNSWESSAHAVTAVQRGIEWRIGSSSRPFSSRPAAFTAHAPSS